MKTKEEILNSYYSPVVNGLPEITGVHLLKAMEDYKQQCLEEAFYAARIVNETCHNLPDYQFATFEDYLKTTQKKTLKEKRDDLSESITLVADSILPNFLPEDNAATDFSFDFNMMGIGYTAFYHKDENGYWKLGKWIVGR